MSWLPTDLASFVWGVVLGLGGAYFTGFLREAGRDSWQALKKRLFPSPPEPVKVEGTFVATLYDPGSCVWVPEERIYDYERKSYSYYPHPKNGAKCFREVWTGSQKHIEFLMAAPSAKRRAST